MSQSVSAKTISKQQFYLFFYLQHFIVKRFYKLKSVLENFKMREYIYKQQNMISLGQAFETMVACMHLQKMFRVIDLGTRIKKNNIYLT